MIRHQSSDYEDGKDFMHNSWDGVTFKLDMARFYLDEMRKDLIPATATRESYYYQTSTVEPMNQWAPKFYYHLDAFLVAARSVDYVITTTFGWDKAKALESWFDTLVASEQRNRKIFQSEYDTTATLFRRHCLTHIRNVSVHRSGTPLVEVAVVGRWGTEYRGGPTQGLPTFEQLERQAAAESDDPPLGWMPLMASPIEPRQDEFFIQEVLPSNSSQDHPLFQSCEAYLQLASKLVDDAKQLADLHHRPQSVTPPPI
jgi:hypothetical protein